MRHSLILSFLGWMTAALSAAMLLPLMTALFAGEGREGILFAAAMMISSAGAGLMIFTGRQSGRELTQADLCLLAVLGWALGIFVAALPLWIILDLSPAKVYFLSASALTTTGASIFANPEELAVSIRLWLAFLQWLGGLASLIMAMMVLAPLGVGGMTLRRVAGTSGDVQPKQGFFRALQIVGPIYTGLTFFCAMLLFFGGVSFFESICLAFSTLSTGGLNLGFEGWILNAPYVKFILALFMLIGAMNMAQYYLLLRGRATLRQDLERRVFLALVVVSAIALSASFLESARVADEEVTSIFAGGWGELILDQRWRDALGEGLFVGISLISTTGWAAADVQTPFIFTLLLTFIGGMTISTAGGLKILRVLLLLRQSRKELSLLSHPHDVKGVYFDGEPIHIPLMQTVWVFFALFNASIAMLMLLLAFTGLSFEHSLAAAVAAIANAGPMVNMVNIDGVELYASLPDAASWAMSLGMIGGRVELLALLSLASPIFWKKTREPCRVSRSVYVNGQWRDYRHARVHVEDRGFQFADGVYETFAVHHGVIIDVEAHLDRLARSLSELQMDWPVARRVLPHLMFETRRRNYVSRGLVYVQVTRGQAKRDHLFPKAVKSSLIIIARHLPAAAMLQRQQGIEVITKPDERWRRCDIKSISLLANVLARQAAGEQGAQEAWLVNEQGIITEGSASNAWIVDREKLITHKSGTDILNGITRLAVMEIAQSLGLTVDETGFSRDQALEADEAFITSSVGGITPVVRLDGQPIGAKDGASGGQGAITQKIQAAFAAKIDQL